MQVSDLMTRDVRIANAGETIQQAARLMASLDSGVLPVGDRGRLVGMVTDRDIAIRAVAEGRGPETKVRDVMSAELKYCFADQEIEEITDNMGDLQLRRLPVLDRDKKLVGIISLGDVAFEQGGGDGIGNALGAISTPGGQHSQSG
ncbi:MAG: CBS domain-containing protein [Proteobacteria bacterium]|nr:CBS domain-containing protein [Pseudomonadota bacterium]